MLIRKWEFSFGILIRKWELQNLYEKSLKNNKIENFNNKLLNFIECLKSLNFNNNNRFHRLTYEGQTSSISTV